MLNRCLIINADGYGISAGINKAIEECIDFGTVRSISVNVNFPHAKQLSKLVKRHPELSVGCHLNPVIGKPVSPIKKVKSLVNEKDEFFYKEFNRKFIFNQIDINELKTELFAQIDLCRDLAGSCFSHIDCHMGKHRLPRFYSIFLESVQYSGTRRIRTHRYKLAMECKNRYLGVIRYYSKYPLRIGTYHWNLWLRYRAKYHKLSMPDWWVSICEMGQKPETIFLDTWIRLIKNIPNGISEFVVHPGYVDATLKKWSTYISQREEERKILISKQFRNALLDSDIKLLGYRNIKVNN